jgi:ATP sulfurylase
MRLTSGQVWSIPITLPADRELADSIKDGQRVALQEPDGHILAIITVQEKFTYDKQREAREVFRTEEDKHPGVARLYKQGEVLLGGPVEVVDLPHNRPFMEHRLTPAETAFRRRLEDR